MILILDLLFYRHARYSFFIASMITLTCLKRGNQGLDLKEAKML